MRTSQFARCFLPAQSRVWNDHPYSVFYTVTLDWLKAAVNRWLLPRVCFSVLRGAGGCGVAKQFISNFVFPTWACDAGFNNNNNNNKSFSYLKLFLKRYTLRSFIQTYMV